MNGIILWLMGNTIFLCGLFQLIPFLHSLSQGYDGVTGAFAASILLALLFGSILLGRWQQGWTAKYSFNILDGAAFMFVCWWMLSIFGSLPYYFSEDISFIEAVFEGVSCFTTTGIGNLAGEVNPSLVLWRSISQWLGGYVVLFLICTILPGTSGIFGTVFAMPGNMRTGAITLKRIKNTGIRLFNIYVVASLLVMVLYALGGMGFFEAINMGLVTISTGGCYVPEAEIQGWLILPMFLCAVLAGGNTLLYFQGDNKKWQRLFREILLSTEVRVFGAMLGIFTISIAMHLYLQGMYNGKDSLINALFHVLSFACTTGVMIDSMLHWGDLEKFLLLILVLIGGCIGSLGGGFKLFRLMVLFKSFLAELKRTLHPNMIPRILIDGKSIPQELADRILGYFFMYVAVFSVSLLIISLGGFSTQQTLDIATGCFTSTGQVMLFHSSYEEIRSMPELLKLYCALLMIVGKINIFTFLLVVNGSWLKLQKRRW